MRVSATKGCLLSLDILILEFGWPKVDISENGKSHAKCFLKGKILING